VHQLRDLVSGLETDSIDGIGVGIHKDKIVQLLAPARDCVRACHIQVHLLKRSGGLMQAGPVMAGMHLG
jgi:hypothetical protein